MSHTIYYKTAKTSATGQKVQSLITKGEQVAEQIKKLCRELGSSENYLKSSLYVFGSDVSGFQFADEPDMSVWRIVKQWDGFYTPRMSNKKGREIAARMAQFERIDRSEIGKCIGMDDFLRSVGFCIGNDHFAYELRADWEHSMPEDCIEITTTEFLAIKRESKL